MWSDLNRIAAVGDAEDHVKIVMRGKNNRVVDMEISGGTAISEPVYIVLGSKGALSSDDRTIDLRYLNPRKGLPRRRAKSGPPEAIYGSGEKLGWIEKTLKVHPKGPDSKKDIWGHLYSAIRAKKRFPVRLTEAVEVMKIISEAKKGTRFN